MTDHTEPAPVGDGLPSPEVALLAEVGDADDAHVMGTFADNADDFDPSEGDETTDDTEGA